MVKNIFIGVPVHNEEKTIEKTIRSIYNSLEYIDYNYKVCVCFNGTKDNSKLILENLKKEYKNLYLIESEKGKTNAIRKIINQNKNFDIGIFFDGDCIVDKYCIKNMIKNLETEKALCVTGNPRPYVRKAILYNIMNIRMIYPKAEIAKFPINNIKTKPYVHGRVYGLKNEIFNKLLSSNFSESKGDDTYLTHFLLDNYGRSSLIKCYDCRVYYQPVSSIISWWHKWTRIWSDVDNIYQLKPNYKYLKKYMITKIDWKYVRTLHIKIQLLFILERLLKFFGYIIYKTTSYFINYGWKSLLDTKR